MKLLAFVCMFGITFAQQPTLQGRYFAAINDGDFLASTYADGILPSRVPDYLSIIGLPLSDEASPAQLEVSNSVVATPFVMDATPDGNNLFVTEMLGPSNPEIKISDDLPPGQRVTAIDVSNPQVPQLKGTLSLGTVNPETIDVNPAGDLLLLTTQTPGHELIFMPLTNGEMGKLRSLTLRASASHRTLVGMRTACT